MESNLQNPADQARELSAAGAAFSRGRSPLRFEKQWFVRNYCLDGGSEPSQDRARNDGLCHCLTDWMACCAASSISAATSFGCDT
jgi:hypothetical protein